MSTKSYIKGLIKKDLSEIRDNLVRANTTFGDSDLDEEYGESGETKRQILKEYYDQELTAVTALKLVQWKL